MIKPNKASSIAAFGSQLLDQSRTNQVTLQINEASKKASMDSQVGKLEA